MVLQKLWTLKILAVSLIFFLFCASRSLDLLTKLSLSLDFNVRENMTFVPNSPRLPGFHKRTA